MMSLLPHRRMRLVLLQGQHESRDCCGWRNEGWLVWVNAAREECYGYDVVVG